MEYSPAFNSGNCDIDIDAELCFFGSVFCDSASFFGDDMERSSLLFILSVGVLILSFDDSIVEVAGEDWAIRRTESTSRTPSPNPNSESPSVSTSSDPSEDVLADVSSDKVDSVVVYGIIC